MTFLRPRDPSRRPPTRKPLWAVPAPPIDADPIDLDVSFTIDALRELLVTVGGRPPESGAKLFGPVDGFGVDVVEFDVHGSQHAGGAVYAPDTEWGSERLDFWIQQPGEACRIWTGDAHSHPGSFGWPSARSGPGLGDLGYVEAVFEQNEIQFEFCIPILTGTGTGEPIGVHPWVVLRSDPLRPRWANFRVCRATDFPARRFNPAFEAAADGGNDHPHLDLDLLAHELELQCGRQVVILELDDPSSVEIDAGDAVIRIDLDADGSTLRTEILKGLGTGMRAGTTDTETSFDRELTAASLVAVVLEAGRTVRARPTRRSTTPAATSPLAPEPPTDPVDAEPIQLVQDVGGTDAVHGPDEVDRGETPDVRVTPEATDPGEHDEGADAADADAEHEEDTEDTEPKANTAAEIGPDSGVYAADGAAVHGDDAGDLAEVSEGAVGFTQAEYYARAERLLSPSFHERSILVVGASGGSYLIEKLARLGPRRLVIVDPDVVEVPNLVRTAFRTTHLGMPKPDAMAELVASANPFVQVDALARDITGLDHDEVAKLLDGIDLIIAGTDSFAAQSLMNRWSQSSGIAAVFIGVHEGAAGGIVRWSIPGETACYRCAAPGRYEAAESDDPALDLTGEAGLLIDVQAIDMVAASLAVGLLDRGTDTPKGHLVERLGDCAQVVVSTSPAYNWGQELFASLTSDLPPAATRVEDLATYLGVLPIVTLPTPAVPDCPDCALFREAR